MSHDALEVVKLRKNFYQDSYRIVVVVLLVAILIIAGLAATIGYEVTHRAQPKYFATTSDGKLIPMIPLDRPNMTDQSLLKWVSSAIISLYTYDFLNFRADFQQNQKYFTDRGWKAFLDSLAKSNNLQAVQQQKLTVQAVPAGAPIITRQGILDGRYSWQIQMPILVTYESLSQQFNQQLLITIMVQRLSTLSSEYGIGISQLVEQQS